MTLGPPDAREPLEVAAAIAGRFMKLQPRPTYMYQRGLMGLLDLWEATGEQRYLDFYMAQCKAGEAHFDWLLWLATGDQRWLHGARERAEQFLADPRRDREGVLLDPRGRYTIDVFSGHLALAIVCGHVLKDHRFFDEASRLFEINRGYLEDPLTGVWYSRFGHALHPCRPNPGLWGRGNGWLAEALGRVMHLWDRNHSGYERMLEAWQEYCRSIGAFQRPSGLFGQLLNRDDCFEEASASGLFCAGFANGVRRGTLPREFGALAYRAFCGLRGLTDEEGNIHNVSTYAGGYNFEEQYYTSARFNEPHGDGTVMSGCAAVQMMLKEVNGIEMTEPQQRPRIVTQAVPRLLSCEPTRDRPAGEIAPPVLRRALALKELPEHDPHGSTILGLVHWYDNSGERCILARARDALERWGERLAPAARWNVTGELALRTGERRVLEDAVSFVDAELSRMPRDRDGVMLDEAGGYSVDRLYVWLPLLAKAGATTGRRRYFDEACMQLFGHQGWLEDPLTCLWHSAFGHGAHSRRVTPGLWGLGNGYCLAGMVGLMQHLPREHDHYVDVVCLLRRYVEALHKCLPVTGGWRQLLTDLRSFPCVAASALLTYGCAKAILNGWVPDTYYAVASGGVYQTGAMLDAEGNYRFCSRPTGGLDTLEEYAEHRLENDPSALGFVLSACAYGQMCMRPGMNPDERDTRLGAR